MNLPQPQAPPDEPIYRRETTRSKPGPQGAVREHVVEHKVPAKHGAAVARLMALRGKVPPMIGGSL